MSLAYSEGNEARLIATPCPTCMYFHHLGNKLTEINWAPLDPAMHWFCDTNNVVIAYGCLGNIPLHFISVMWRGYM